MSELAFRTAEKHVRNYEQETRDLIAEHREAMDCRDCEAYLQIGIDAFNWLIRADQSLRRAAAEGNEDAYSPEVAAAFGRHCKAWLASCERASEWIARHRDREYEIENLAALRKCCEEMQAIVDFYDAERSESLPPQMAVLRDEALAEFRNGETAEFV